VFFSELRVCVGVVVGGEERRGEGGAKRVG
jgi:hypothetical protein